MSRQTLINIISDFEAKKFARFFSEKNGAFKPGSRSFATGSGVGIATSAEEVGTLRFKDSEETLLVASVKVNGKLTENSSKKAQFNIGKEVLRKYSFDLGIFIFWDSEKNFRFSLIYPEYVGKKRLYNSFRRFTYYVSPTLPNKTFLQQIGDLQISGEYEKVRSVKESFSLAKVTNEFYLVFKQEFDTLAGSVKKDSGVVDPKKAQDFALLFTVRTIFLGFIQKKKWLGDDEKFLEHFLAEYSSKHPNNTFYSRWLKPLFFEALNTAPGHKVAYGNNEFPTHIEKALQMAPHLNGGLFQQKDLDEDGYYFPDSAVIKFYEYLFSYHFTIEENTLYDEELELNPEFLGIIFERLVNKENGAVYTPRMEVDLMCRLSLVEWLSKNCPKTVEKSELFRLFFREGGSGDEFEEKQEKGKFSDDDAKTILDLLENIAICDPAVGSGAFPVGMLQVLDEVEEQLRSRFGEQHQISAFERKRRIIGRSLYGVEVKEWAVWISQLRLWITLFIDATDDMRLQGDPILPSLDFKIRQGDSLVQLLGGKLVPAGGELYLGRDVKKRLTALKKLKEDFYYNKLQASHSNYREIEAHTFGAIFDELLDEKRKELRVVQKNSVDAQGSLFGEKAEAKKEELSLFAEKEKSLQKEIEELESDKRNIKQKHPLVWGIEFAEIFGEKGGFDVVIGNPPYVSSAEIEDPLGRVERIAYMEYLEQMIHADFDDWISKKTKIDGKSDLYVYFYIRGLRLLGKGGVMSYICTNSWLDAGYGTWLQKFLLDHAPILTIIENNAERSFAAADVNTIISLIESPQNKVNPEHRIKFVALRESFEKVVFTENFLLIEDAKEVALSDLIRVYPISVKALLEAGTEYESDENKLIGVGKYTGNKWGGKYLRAPDIYFRIITKSQGKLVSPKKFFAGERYLNTGGADGFYIPRSVIDEGGEYFQVVNDNTVDSPNIFSGEIEKKYLVPLIKDHTKHHPAPIIEDYDAFCVVPQNVSSGEKINNYINWGKQQGYHNRSVTKLQSPWYKPPRQMLGGAELLLPRSFNDRFAVYVNPKKYLSLRFYRLHVIDGSINELAGFFNSTIFWLFFETLGNKNQGQGVLDFYMDAFLATPLPVVLGESVGNAFEILGKRDAKNIFEECGIDPASQVSIEEQTPCPLSDRAVLDKIIFDALNLSTEERSEVYRSLCRLVWGRLSKAKNV